MTDSVETKSYNPTVVFQCRDCHRILGDSTSLKYQNQENKIIALGSAHDIHILQDYSTSQDGFDAGCSFFTVACECGIRLGKMYKTTPRHLDFLRDMFTFNSEYIDLYGVGMARHAPPVSDWFNKSLDTVFTGQAKLMTVILALEERISSLEGANQTHGNIQSVESSSTRSIKRGTTRESKQISEDTSLRIEAEGGMGNLQAKSSQQPQNGIAGEDTKPKTKSRSRKETSGAKGRDKVDTDTLSDNLSVSNRSKSTKKAAVSVEGDHDAFPSSV